MKASSAWLSILQSEFRMSSFMSGGRYRTHSREFKLEVCRQMDVGLKRPAQVCRGVIVLAYRSSFRDAQYKASGLCPGAYAGIRVMEVTPR